MIQKINYLITGFFDIILYPFSFIGPFWGILFLSLVTALIALFGYKYLSSPRAIKQAKDKIKANILGIRLYKDFWKVILGSFARSLFYTGKYLLLNIATILIILPILFPLFVQMDVRYGRRPFTPGETIVVKAGFSENPYNLDIRLLESSLYTPLMNPLYIDAFHDEDHKNPWQEVDWKLVATATGKGSIKIKVGDTVFEKGLVIGKYRDALSNAKFKTSRWDHFIHPAEKLLSPPANLETITIDYPGTKVHFLGLGLPWWVYYLVLVLIIVLALKKRFKVEF